MANALINVNSNISGYTYTLTPVNGGSPITGTVASNQAYIPAPDGVYNLTLTKPGLDTIIHTSVVDTFVSTDVFATVRSTSDIVSSGVSKTPVTNGQVGSSNSIVNIKTPTIASEEYIAPNSNFGKYFTCEDARMYIGDVFIDENIFVQYTLQDNKIPIYGYRSRFYDAVAQGHSIVQGQLGLNYVSSGYLALVLKEYARYQTESDTDQARLNALVYTESEILTRKANGQLFSGATVDAKAAASDTSQLALIQQEKTKLINKLGPSAIDLAQQNLTNIITPDLDGAQYSNAVYSNIAFDLVIRLEGAQRTETRKLEGCRLIANDQVIDLSGATLSDGYSFIARRLR